jgi:hypothetical protein
MIYPSSDAAGVSVGEGLNLLGIWRDASFANENQQTGFGEPGKAIKRENTLFMADHIPDSGPLIEPQVSHFAFLQDPQQFNMDVLHFLMHLKGK